MRRKVVWVCCLMVLGVVAEEEGFVRWSSETEIPVDAEGRLDQSWLATDERCLSRELGLRLVGSSARPVAVLTGEAAEAVFPDKACPAVACVNMGVRVEAAFEASKLRRYPTSEGNATSAVVSWLRKACNTVEVGFVTSAPAKLYWIDGDRRVHQGDLNAGEKNTHWRSVNLNHRFEAEDADGNVVGRYSIRHDAIYNVIRGGPPTSKDDDKAWADRSAKTLAYELKRADKIKRSFTKHGFDKEPLPPGVYADMEAFYRNNYAHGAAYEEWDPRTPHVNWWKTAPHFVQLPFKLKRVWHDYLKPLVEAWIGGRVPLEPTDLYGVRVYHNGSVLLPHVDRETTHAVSVIVNIAQIDLNKPWPVEITDLATMGTAKVAMKPGDMLFYESAKCMHGRPQPLDGRMYVNLFAHYRPLNDPEWFLQDRVPADFVPFDYASPDALSHDAIQVIPPVKEPPAAAAANAANPPAENNPPPPPAAANAAANAAAAAAVPAAEPPLEEKKSEDVPDGATVPKRETAAKAAAPPADNALPPHEDDDDKEGGGDWRAMAAELKRPEPRRGPNATAWTASTAVKRKPAPAPATLDIASKQAKIRQQLRARRKAADAGADVDGTPSDDDDDDDRLAADAKYVHARRLKSRLWHRVFDSAEVLIGLGAGCVFLLLACALVRRCRRRRRRGGAKKKDAVAAGGSARPGTGLALGKDFSKARTLPASIRAAAKDNRGLRQVAAFLDAASNVDVRDSVPPRRTVLQHAAAAGASKIVRACLQAGADPNLADDTGDTAVHLAAIYGSGATVKLLLESGADPDARDALGKTAMDRANDHDNKGCALLIARFNRGRLAAHQSSAPPGLQRRAHMGAVRLPLDASDRPSETPPPGLAGAGGHHRGGATPPAASELFP